MSDDNYCDFCRSSISEARLADGHEDWCPIVEVKRLRTVLREVLSDYEAYLNEFVMDGYGGYMRCRPLHDPDILKRAREALDE